MLATVFLWVADNLSLEFHKISLTQEKYTLKMSERRLSVHVFGSLCATFSRAQTDWD